jgi:hypothetical protein
VTRERGKPRRPVRFPRCPPGAALYVSRARGPTTRHVRPLWASAARPGWPALGRVPLQHRDSGGPHRMYYI